MSSNQKIENKELVNIPKAVHVWEINGFVKLSDKARSKFEELIKGYGVRKLARDLKFDRETLYSIYMKRDKSIHSIIHLIVISNKLNFNLKELEKEVIAFGKSQSNLYNIDFPFILNPLFLRVTAIHGDGSFNKYTNQCSWYQYHDRIYFMEKLLQSLLNDSSLKALKKDNIISYVTIPNAIVYLVCKSLNLDLKEVDSIKFFEKVAQLPSEYKFQVFSQFIIDEGHFKGTTFTVAQQKKESRNGFILLLDSLGFFHSKPKNNKNDITIYGINFPRIISYLDDSIRNYGYLAGFWFKETHFRNICQQANPYNSFKLVKNRI